jgi:hypothetical protein
MFFFVIDEGAQKASVFVLGKPFQPCLPFPITQKEHLSCAPLKETLTANIILGLPGAYPIV